MKTHYNSGRITMAVLATKLDQVIDALQEHREQFREHVAKDEQIAVKVDRLDQSEIRRVWHIRGLWSATVAGAIAWLSRVLQ